MSTEEQTAVHNRTPMDLVADFLAAFNARDLERALAYVAPDYRMERPPGTVMLQGRAALRAAFSNLFAHSPALHVEVRHRYQVGQWVIDEHHLTGANRAGAASERHLAEIYRVVDGAIVSSHIFE